MTDTAREILERWRGKARPPRGFSRRTVKKNIQKRSGLPERQPAAFFVVFCRFYSFSALWRSSAVPEKSMSLSGALFVPSSFTFCMLG